jgi:hypothetical protein
MVRTRNLFVLLAALMALGVSAAPAAAQSLEISEFQTTSSSTLAGDHPDLETKFRLTGSGNPETPENLSFELPQGIYGNPSVLSQCSSVDFSLNQCPPGAQVGYIVLHADYESDPNFLLGLAPVYSVEPAGEEAARFAFNAPILNIPIVMPVNVLSAADYKLQFTFSGATQLAPLAAVDVKFWGFPASPEHQGYRFGKGSPGDPPGCPGVEFPFCANHTEFPKAGVPVLPFTGNPSVCGVELPTVLRVESYQNPGATVAAESSYEPITGCARQTFKPLAQAKLTTENADSASGLDLIVKAGQVQTQAAAPSQLRDVVLRLPEGLTINPDAADGQSDCKDSDAKIGLEVPGECPDNTKIGTIDISSAALPGDLTGSIYFGEPKPNDQYRLLILADGFGIHTKFLGDLLPDPKTGRLTAVFDDLPELPFDEYGIHLFSSDRGVLATPTRCESYTVENDLFPWNNVLPDQKAKYPINIEHGVGGGDCPAPANLPFNPRLEAGTSNSEAGRFSNFTLKLNREDGDQFLGDLNFTMPPGLTGSLRGLTYCPEASIAAAAANSGRAEQASPSCPSSSKLGTTNVAAGPGSHPFHAVGDIYLGGPFKGAPLSLVAITPALAGPYDYGVVVVRVAIDVDPLDAHVIAVSDTVPSIIGGVPIRMRSIRVNLDKPSFMINPTNCSPMSVESQGIGDQGTVTDFSSYFQAINCASLPFAPKFSVRQVGGRKGSRRNANPALRFDLNTRTGDANIKSISVTLPAAYEIDQEHLGNICTEKELAQTRCAGRQAIGTATTTTPLLDRPLTGPVYAVSGLGGLPRLAFLLNGQVSLVPRAETETVKRGLRTTVPVVPDAPVGHFELTVFGGKHGYLLNTRDNCSTVPKVRVGYTGQNGRTYAQTVRVKGPCHSSHKAKRGKHPGH